MNLQGHPLLVLLMVSACTAGTKDAGDDTDPPVDSDSPPDSDVLVDTDPPGETDPPGGPTCAGPYTLPAEVADPGGDGLDQADLEAFAWRSLLALSSDAVGGSPSNTSTLWQGWSSTVDLLLQGANPGPSGSRFYPESCMTAYPDTYQSYRVLDQLDKVDDELLEADRTGLSNSPVIAGNGTFLRYEILLSPLTYSYVVAARYNLASTMSGATANLVMPCGDPTYTGGDPAEGSTLPVDQMLDAGTGSIVLKLAWMDTAGIDDTSSMFTDQLLVYTPAYRNTHGEASCTLKTMALVGMHMVRKTMGQQAWTWSTIEHRENAPDCTGLLPASNPGNPGPGPNTGCPASAGSNYWLYPTLCNDSAACAACNETPATNGTCTNPNQPGDPGWCPNEPPAGTGGTSRICRQVPVTADGPYAAAFAQNAACTSALSGSVWSNYEVISTQWFTGSTPATATCGDISATVVGDKDNISPLVAIEGPENKPFLGNTTMESYERSNCMGCHSKATTTAPSGPNGECGKAGKFCSDFGYWLGIEVPAEGN